VKAALILLVRLFPEDFRDQFAAGMIEQIERDQERARSRGRLAALWHALATALDLVSCAIAEHWSPNWVDPNRSPAEGRGMGWTLSEWARDLRYAWRSLSRTPGFTVMAVGMLGLAIGAGAGMFSVVKTVLLDPLPYASADRLVYIGATAPGSDMPDEIGVGSEFFVHYKERSRLLEDVSTYNSFTSTLRVGDRVERIRMSWPTHSLFTTLGARPALGRLPVAEDESRVAVISHALWQSWFGGDPDVVGRSYYASGEMRTVIGVMGPEFRFPDNGTLLWISSEIRPEGVQPGRFGGRLVARMAPGATPEAVASELTALARELPERFGGSAAYARVIEQHRALVRPLAEQLLGGVARPLWVLLGAACLVLLIACANVTSLFLVRAEGRHRDLAVRRALGAARGQLMRLQMAEAVIIACLAGTLAMLLAQLVFPLFLQTVPADVPRIDQVGLGIPTLLFALAAAAATAVACGAIPALRGSVPDLAWLRTGSRGLTPGRHWTQSGLVVGQTALALVLLVGSALLVRSFWSLRSVDPGYETAQLFTFQIAPERPELSDGPSWARFHMDFMERLRALPGVESVGLVENVPLDEGVRTGRFRTEASAAGEEGGPLVGYTWAAGDYFAAMGIELLQGRVFETADHVSAPGNVLVSRRAAELLWPGQDSVGQRLRGERDETWHTVVGVVEDVLQYGFRDTPQPLVYLPLVGPTPAAWRLSSPAYVLKTRRAEQIAPEVRALAREVAPEAPMYRAYTMEELAARSMADLSFTMLTLGIAAGLALVLGAVGLYGVLSYVVAERTREIGVRMALGARAEQVLGMVVAQGARIVMLGVALGIVAAIASMRALDSLLFGVESLDMPTFAGMSVGMVLIGLLASYLPARRASKVDPIESLRAD
jgi:putative ABC transport system permease protein